MVIGPEWLAGFFDGEGCINITVAGKHRRCILRLYLVNTDYVLLKEIQVQYGGQFVRRPHPKKPQWKDFCALIWTNRQAVGLLDTIEPFIIAKKKQLALARQFLLLRDDPNRYESSSVIGVKRAEKNFGIRLRPEILVQEQAIKDAMHALNHKGTVV